MKYDDIYAHIGQMGLLQKIVCAEIFFFSLFGLDAVQMIFIGADMDHWCLTPELTRLSDDMQRNIASPAAAVRHKTVRDATNPLNSSHIQHPLSLDNKTQEFVDYSSCSQFNINYSEYSNDDLLGWDRKSFIAEHNPSTVRCQQWSYDRSTFTSTIISRFDLVCGYEYLNQLSSTLFMAGSLVGGVLAGILADKIGRKKSMLIFLLVKVAALLMSALSLHYTGFALGRFILGVGSSACAVNAYVLLMEIVGPRYRSFAGCGIQLSLSVGFLLQPLIALVTRNDVTFQLVFVVPNLITFAVLIFLPESPRWYIVVGRYKEADRVFRLMCRANGTTLPDDYDVRDIEKDDGERGNYLLLLRSPRLRWRTIIINITWFTSSAIYFAMTFNVGYLPGDIFVNTALSSGLEIPAIFICIFVIESKRLGRRGSALWSFMLTGTLVLLCIPVELYVYGSGRIALTVFNVVCKAVIVLNFAVLYVYVAEIFPTEVRNSAMGVAQMFNYLGGVVAPYIGEPMATVWIPLPYVILCLLSVLSGLLCILLPETRGRPLFDTVEQAERNGRQEKACTLLTKLEN